MFLWKKAFSGMIVNGVINHDFRLMQVLDKNDCAVVFCKKLVSFCQNYLFIVWRYGIHSWNDNFSNVFNVNNNIFVR